METDPPKVKIKDESEEESEEKSDKKLDMEASNNIILNLEQKLEKSNNSIEDQDNEDLEIFSEKCELLKMTTVPTFGKYSTDYTFLEQILILKSKSKFENLPESVKNRLENLKKKIS